MGKILHVTVANKVATYNRRDGSIVCGNSDYQIQFVFDSEWDAHAVKTARFLYNSTAMDVPFEGDTVAVPILRNTVLLSVGVFAGDLQTTTSATIPCIKSILCQDGLPPDPEPDVYTKLMAMLNAGGGKTPVSIDLTTIGPDDAGKGRIVEAYADGSTQETELTYDEDGNLIKIGDTALIWSKVLYSITYNAPNCTIDPMPATIDEGGRLELLAWSNEGYNLGTIQMTMGGVDITETAVAQQGNDAQLRIESVTGDVVITVATNAAG